MKTTEWDLLKKGLRLEAGLPLTPESTIPPGNGKPLAELTEVLFSEVEVTIKARSSTVRPRREA